MEAYAIYKKIKEYWQKLSMGPSGASVTRHYADIPIYVRRNGVLHKVNDITLVDNKIVLDTENE